MQIKKRYIFGTLFLMLIILFFASILGGSDIQNEAAKKSKMLRFGQKPWTFNMNKKEWRVHKDSDDDASKEEIVLQVQMSEGNGGYTIYHLLTGNAQIPKEDFWVGEGSQEFLKGKNLYSYFPKNFEFYEIIFNGVKFVPRKLSEEKVFELFKGYQFIRVSELKKGNNTFKFSKISNRYIVINDIGESFYKYYVVPNDSKKLQIEEFSNQFKILEGGVDVKLQRLEGCSEAYPCYDIHIEG